MPDQKPTPTTRDRELANRALDNSPITCLSQREYFVLRDQVEAVVREARREGVEEGREEGRRQYGFQEGQRVGLEAAVRELKRLTDDLEERARPLRRLPDPPAPPGAEE